MRTTMMRNVTILSMAATLVLTCCGKKETKNESQEAIKVKTMTVGTSTTQGDYNYSGTVEEENGTLLSFILGGTVTRLNAKVGDHVRRGQLIATVDPTSIRNSYDMAHATRIQAEDAYQRMKQLHDKGSLPEIKWVEVENKLSQAVSAENIAKKNLTDCKLYAPHDGIVSEKYLEPGQNVAPGVPVIKIVTTHTLNVKVSVPESEIAMVNNRQPANVMVPALNNQTVRGYVIEKGVIADPISRTYNIKIRLEGNHAGLLPGMVVKVAMNKAASSDNIIIPVRLIQLGDDNTYFVWVSEQGKAVRRTVVCGEYGADGVQIVRGLKDGDKIIVEGQQKVCTGTKLSEK